MNGEMTLSADQESAGLMFPATSTPAAIQMAAAILDKRLTSARAFPRSIARFKKEATDLLKEDIETARSAEYAKPVGGGTVRGPSIRLAELVAMCWGNLDVEVAEPMIGDKHVTVKATAWDLQRNYRQEAIATTTIINKQGQRYKDAMIETAINATAAKAKRNAILAVVPRAFVNDLLEVAKQVVAGNAEPLEVTRAKLIEFFARSHKLTQEQVCSAVGADGLADIGQEQIDDLRAIATALKEGSSVEEFFPDAGKSKADEVRDKLKQRQASSAANGSKPAAKPEDKPEPGKLFSGGTKLPD